MLSSDVSEVVQANRILEGTYVLKVTYVVQAKLHGGPWRLITMAAPLQQIMAF
jgi:hypothetical protein